MGRIFVALQERINKEAVQEYASRRAGEIAIAYFSLPTFGKMKIFITNFEF
jgi:hypothetical protein